MSAQPAGKIEPMHFTRPDLNVIITSKLDQTDLVGPNKDFNCNVIIQPVRDQYSCPQRFCLISAKRLEDKDQVVTVEAEVRSRPRTNQEGNDTKVVYSEEIIA